MLLSVEHSALVIVDVQERLAPAIPEIERIVQRLGLLIDVAGASGVPPVTTEQHPQGLGPTLAPLLDRLSGIDGGLIVPKIAFSAVKEPVFLERLLELRIQGRRQIILGGLEAHICVLQTAIDLADRGFDVAVVADAVGSRSLDDRQIAFQRLIRHGVDIVTSEMVVYEWLGRAGTDLFRKILPLIRNR